MESTSPIEPPAPLPPAVQGSAEATAAPPRDAATVVMLRDGAAGVEVFLQKRHALSDVLGGAYVFPGGKVDARDRDTDLQAYLDRPAYALHAALNEPKLDSSSAAGLYVAAVREVFEESGVLFAHDVAPQCWLRAGALMHSGCAFDRILAQLGLRLHTQSLVPWSRWVTPQASAVAGKRFDTRFFISTVPAGQRAHQHNHETIDSVWWTPRDALGRYWRGEIALAPPQIMGLAHLGRYRNVAEALQAARRRPPPLIAPHVLYHEGVRTLCYPGDAQHPVRERALPGPTRLVQRKHRMEPPDGFDGFFRP